MLLQLLLLVLLLGLLREADRRAGRSAGEQRLDECARLHAGQKVSGDSPLMQYMTHGNYSRVQRCRGASVPAPSCLSHLTHLCTPTAPLHPCTRKNGGGRRRSASPPTTPPQESSSVVLGIWVSSRM